MEHFNISKNNEECDRESLIEMVTKALDYAIEDAGAAEAEGDA
jgi:hypothetical protein